MVDELINISSDLSATTSTHGTQIGDSHDLLGEPHAPGAVDAPVHRGGDQRTEVLVFNGSLVFSVSALVVAIDDADVLEIALSSLVADRTVERVVGQQELHHTSSGVAGHFRLSDDLHAVGYLTCAGCHGLGGAGDLDQTHSAVAGHFQALVVAESRNDNAALARNYPE